MNRYVLLLFCTGLTICFATAQTTDSIRVDYATDTAWVTTTQPANSPRRVRVWYRRFIRAQHQELTLVKLTALPFFGGGAVSGSYWGYNAHMGIERKLSPAFSVNVENLIYYQNFRRYADHVYMRAMVGGRWYYRMNQRIAQGLSANNLSSNYLSINALVPVWRQFTLTSDATLRNPLAQSLLNAQPEPGALLLTWGIQRRLGRYGYFDFSTGPYKSFKPGTSLNWSLNFTIGLGL
jgi:hypothetical protein